MNIRELHYKAMELASLADFKMKLNETEQALSLYEQSYSLEKEAAMNAYKENIDEPTVSVLLRSAASLAMNCKKLREAEKLIALALSGEPPSEIAEELRDLLENVNFYRHLEVKGAELSDDEVQLVISGNGIGYGYAKANEIIKRIDLFTDLMHRTAERLTDKSFRKGGQPSAEYKEIVNPYISAPIAACMAFRLKFGKPNKQTLQGFSRYESIIDDINDNIEFLNDNRIDCLKDKIKNDAYLTNFLGLTKELAPDGLTVKLFGITSIKQGRERKTMLTTKREKIGELLKSTQSESINSNITIETGATGKVTGFLKIADATKDYVKIISEDTNIELKVPDGLSDIVKKYWDEKVLVEYHKKNKKENLLVNIEEVKE